MRQIRDLLEQAIFAGLNMPNEYSNHSIIRYMERFCGIDVAKIKAEYMASKYDKRSLQDKHIFHHLKNNFRDDFDRALEDLDYIIKGNTRHFQKMEFNM